jgi:hypothetical protein
MSATLGPIHYWLFTKIKVQNSIVEQILSSIESKEFYLDIKNKLDQQFKSIDNRPLEELIDTTNIHGWLQECVSIVENRLAYVVTNLLKEDSKAIDNLMILFKNAGRGASSLNKDASIQEIYKEFGDTLLDGMPCDHVNTVVSQHNEEVVWKRNVCVHEQYWVSVGGDIRNYYLLREEFMKGMLSDVDASFEKIDEITSKIEKY